MVYPEGSYANGGVMRIAPVGLAFRNASNDQLHSAVVSALLCTHVHPEAIDGAYIQVTRYSKFFFLMEFGGYCCFSIMQCS